MLVEFIDVGKHYEDFFLENISFTINQGDRLAIQGPSGSGKSTLVDLILGLEEADSGQIIRNFNRVSTVFQEDRLIEDLSIQANIKAVTERDPVDILRALGLENPQQRAGTLSGGMKRRLALARALAYDGDLLILDEPFTGLDEKIRDQAIDAIKSFSTAQALILVSHRPKDFEDLDMNKALFLG